MATRILSVSYDFSLLTTRALILQKAGHEVVSAYGLVDAMLACKEGTFDLVIIGHSIPRSEKEALLHEIRATCGAPVLSLYKRAEGPIEGVDYALDGLEGPDALVSLIRKALDQPTR